MTSIDLYRWHFLVLLQTPVAITVTAIGSEEKRNPKINFPEAKASDQASGEQM